MSQKARKKMARPAATHAGRGAPSSRAPLKMKIREERRKASLTPTGFSPQTLLSSANPTKGTRGIHRLPFRRGQFEAKVQREYVSLRSPGWISIEHIQGEDRAVALCSLYSNVSRHAVRSL